MRLKYEVSLTLYTFAVTAYLFTILSRGKHYGNVIYCISETWNKVCNLHFLPSEFSRNIHIYYVLTMSNFLFFHSWLTFCFYKLLMNFLKLQISCKTLFLQSALKRHRACRICYLPISTTFSGNMNPTWRNMY